MNVYGFPHKRTLKNADKVLIIRIIVMTKAIKKQHYWGIRMTGAAFLYASYMNVLRRVGTKQ